MAKGGGGAKGSQGSAARAKESKLPQRDSSWGVLDEVGAIVSLAAAAFLLVSFVTYQRGAIGENFGGPVGYGLANIVVQALGLAAYLLAPCLLVVGWMLFRHSTREISLSRAVGVGGFILSLAVALGLALPTADPVEAGGFVGGFVGRLMSDGFGRIGAGLITGSLLSLSFLFATQISFRAAAGAARGAARGGAGRVWSALRAIRLRRPRPEIERQEPRLISAAGVSPRGALKRLPPEKPKPGEKEGRRPSDPVIVLQEPLQAPRRKAKPQQQELKFGADSNYQPPPLDFLDAAPRTVQRIDEEALRRSSEILETKLADFGIEGKVVQVLPGPVITTYEIEPAPGVKVSRIVTLADDLSMALRAPSIRILAPVPGKAVVGIEVANPRRERVTLREVLDSESFSHSESTLTMALGKDATGHPVAADLVRMPHLLIAGATGAGKSVSLNTMIISVLYKASPRDVRFVMIDMKMLELSMYEDIPHLLVPVVTDPKKGVAVLRNLVQQMDDRYQLLKEKGVRSIEGYNKLVDREHSERAAGVIELDDVIDDDDEDEAEGGGFESAPRAPRHTHMPKIVVIIDELADLMITAGRDVEEPITRLAQKARACGIHLILATQRPSVDVITGLIKANFPARMSFQVTSRVDSRTILDSIGAERLLGGGDMLYLPAGTARAQRLHGGFVSETEIHRIVDFVKRQGAPSYAMELLEEDEEEAGDEFEEDLSDEMYDQAIRVVTQSRIASISYLQRRLRVGYNRAARMIERMERDQIVSSGVGGKPREVLVPPVAGDEGEE